MNEFTPFLDLLAVYSHLTGWGDVYEECGIHGRKLTESSVSVTARLLGCFMLQNPDTVHFDTNPRLDFLVQVAAHYIAWSRPQDRGNKQRSAKLRAHQESTRKEAGSFASLCSHILR